MATSFLIPAAEMKAVFRSILLRHQFTLEKAETCAQIFTANSLDGVYTHGVNRFPVFVQMIIDGHVHPQAESFLVHAAPSLEQWDGALAPGVLNAVKATDRAIELAKQSCLGCVALANTNHWM